MKLGLLWVGKTRDRNISSAIQGYLKRVARYVAVDITEIKEAPASDEHSEKEALQKEGRRIREKVPRGHQVVVMDPRGEEMSSEEFGRFLERKINSSSSSLKGLTFVIGGHLGLDEEAKAMANHTISMSRMTLTHEMARLLLVEQIYRGLSMARGGQYHRR